MATLDGTLDTTRLPAGFTHSVEALHIASLKISQTAADLDARGDLREVMLALGLKVPFKQPPPPECGTDIGFALHRQRGEKPCTACNAAHGMAARTAKAEREAARAAGVAARPIVHGTPAGFMAHYRRGEPACLPCVDAEHARKTQPPKGERRRPPCGTRQGYEAHLRRKEEACEPCRNAKATYRRDKLAEARAAREKATAEARKTIDAMLASLPLGTSDEAAAERGERVDALLDRVLGGVS